MNDNANREVRLSRRDMRRVFALGDKLVVIVYVGGGMSISHALFGFPRFHVETDHLILAFASFIVVGTGWVICRSILRQRKAATSHEDNGENSFHG